MTVKIFCVCSSVDVLGVVKTRNAGISRNFAEYAGISRNFAEYHGISRNITAFRGTFVCRMTAAVMDDMYEDMWHFEGK